MERRNLEVGCPNCTPLFGSLRDERTGWLSLTPPTGGDWQGLMDSERRRRALELSLAKVGFALQNQSLGLVRRAGPTYQNTHRQMWELNIGEIKAPKLQSFLSGGLSASPYTDLYKRAGKLQLDLEMVRCQMDQVLNTGGEHSHLDRLTSKQDRPVSENFLHTIRPDNQRDGQGTIAHLIALAMDNSHLLRERGDLERLLQDAWARLGVAVEQTEASEARVSSLSSELFRARSREQELHREALATQAQLQGSEQMNEELLQKMAALRKRLGTAEERAAVLESGGRLLNARLGALELEREQLLEQGHRLPPREPGGRALEMNVEDSGRREEEVEEEEEDPMETRALAMSQQPQSSEGLCPGPIPTVLGQPDLATAPPRGLEDQHVDSPPNEPGIGAVSHWNPWHYDPVTANQVTALVIELQQLRVACRDVTLSPDPTVEHRARDWLERAAVLKECVGEMERNRERLAFLQSDRCEASLNKMSISH